MSTPPTNPYITLRRNPEARHYRGSHPKWRWTPCSWPCSSVRIPHPRSPFGLPEGRHTPTCRNPRTGRRSPRSPRKRTHRRCGLGCRSKRSLKCLSVGPLRALYALLSVQHGLGGGLCHLDHASGSDGHSEIQVNRIDTCFTEFYFNQFCIHSVRDITNILVMPYVLIQCF